MSSMKVQILSLVALLATQLSQTNAQGGRRGQNGLLRESTNSVTCSKYDKAADGDKVTISYTGKLSSNGKVFDTTEGKKPIEFVLGSGIVIKGWDQGLVGTCPGESLKLTIPPELGYGEKGAGNGVIPPNAELIFELTLEDIDKDIQIETLEGGECEEDKRVRRKDNVTLHYTARLAEDGRIFDSSYDRNVPLTFIVGDVGIRGWDDGVYKACVGEVRRVVVPWRHGYGEAGVPSAGVPPKSTVILEMEVLKIGNRVDLFLRQISQGLFGR